VSIAEHLLSLTSAVHSWHLFPVRAVADLVEPTVHQVLRKAEELGLGPEAVRRDEAKGSLHINFDIHASALPIDVYLRNGVLRPRMHRGALRYGFLREMLFGQAGKSLFSK